MPEEMRASKMERFAAVRAVTTSLRFVAVLEMYLFIHRWALWKGRLGVRIMARKSWTKKSNSPRVKECHRGLRVH